MPRDPKPWFRKDRDAWFVTINGRRFNLGPDKEAAFNRFYDLMLRGEEEQPNQDDISVFQLFDAFLEWTSSQRAPRTYEWYKDFLERFSDLFVCRGVPAYLRSDNGSEFTATKVREWLSRVGVKTLFIEPGSPWENGYIENFNGKLRDELLAREQFDTLLEAKVLIECWRKHYNTVRPHSSLGYRAPAPETIE